jgi:YHS domain-containing protein
MRFVLNLGAALILGLAAVAGADDLGKQMTDPVSSKTVTVAKDTPYVVVNETRLYFTDARSRETFLKAPETYLKSPQECLVRGLKGKANKANRLVVNDQILYFCCANCPQGFLKEPTSYLTKLTDPVSGKEFNLASDSPKAAHKGGTYFFESEQNKAAFEKDPAKYAKVVLQ